MRCFSTEQRLDLGSLIRKSLGAHSFPLPLPPAPVPSQFIQRIISTSSHLTPFLLKSWVFHWNPLWRSLNYFLILAVNVLYSSKGLVFLGVTVISQATPLPRPCYNILFMPWNMLAVFTTLLVVLKRYISIVKNRFHLSNAILL